MAFMNKLFGRDKKETDITDAGNSQEMAQQLQDTLLASDMFPMVQASDVDLSHYQKIPFAGLAALGAAFAKLPESMRTITQTKQLNGAGLFRRIIPQGPGGTMQMARDGVGELGNVMRVNAKGQNVIVARARYQQVGPLSSTVTTVLPPDPMTLAIAAALMRIEQKLDDIQKTQQEILAFLTQQEKAKQRGNLNALSEIIGDYKLNWDNEKYRTLKYVLVQDIKRDAEQSLCLYQEQIAGKLKNQAAIHIGQQASDLLSKVQDDFVEYRLAVYLYAFSSFLEIMLLETFGTEQLTNAETKISKYATRYGALFSSCHAQLADYTRGSIEHQVASTVGDWMKSLGKLVESTPLGQTQLDETLIGAGEQLGRTGHDATEHLLEKFDVLREAPVTSFTDNIRALNCIYHAPMGMLADEENLYVLDEKSTA